MTVIQHRRGTTAEWAASSYILEAGEIGVEIDTSTTPDTVIGAKIGNGESLWSSLSYVGQADGVGIMNVVEDLTPQLGGDLDAQSYNISTVNSITLDTTPTGVPATDGTISWDVDNETLNVKLPGVNLQVGQEHIVRVKNNSGSVAIPDRTLVMFAGATGDTIKATPAITSNVSVYPSDYIIGITTEEIAADGFGFVTQFGFINNVDTSAWAVGTLLYPDPATPGGFVTSKPAAPAWQTPIAAVTKQNISAGRIFVRAIPGIGLGSVENVEISSPADNEVLAYDNASGTWINQTPSEAGLAALSGATFTGTVVMSNVGVEINDTDSRVGRIIGSGNIMYIQGGADSADTTGRVIIGRTASSSNLSQLDLRADTTNVTGTISVTGATTLTGALSANGGITGATAKNMTVASSYHSTGGFNGTRVVMVGSSTGSSDPTTRPDGTALQAGDIWIDW